MGGGQRRLLVDVSWKQGEKEGRGRAEGGQREGEEGRGGQRLEFKAEAE